MPGRKLLHCTDYKIERKTIFKKNIFLELKIQGVRRDECTDKYNWIFLKYIK